jgi:ATP-dependent RNA helicase RhlE
MPFTALGLMPELTRALADRNYVEPTPVQAKVIPEILAGRDILAGAQTGTGKTAGFTLPILQKLSENPNPGRGPRALILVPTRELAAQVTDSVRSYGKYLRLRTAVVFGGVSANPQIDALRRGLDILVATPGRLLDHAEQRNVDLSQVQILVLDEADRMLDMGFIRDIRRVLKLLPAKRQNLMFSATYSGDIRELAHGLLRNPAEVEVARRNMAVEAVEQRAYRVRKEDKRALLSHLIHEGDWSQVLVFTRTKHGANRLTKQLMQDGIQAAAIHGNKSQNARTQALADFKNFDIRVLVATEVASRGLDIKELPHVINYELPNVPEDYVHRIGRTGRAGATGIAISLVSPDEQGLLKDIEKVLRKSVPVAPTPTFAPAPPPLPDHNERYRDPRAANNPRRSGGGQRGRSAQQRQPQSSQQSRPSTSQAQKAQSPGFPGAQGQRAPGGNSQGGGQHHQRKRRSRPPQRSNGPAIAR